MRRRHWILAGLLAAWPLCAAGQPADPAALLDPARHGPGALLQALEALDAYHPPQARAAASALLAHPEADVARAAGWYLRREGRSAEGVEAAQAALVDAAQPVEARRAAALALGALRDAAGLGPLETALGADPAPEVRAAAAEALGELARAGAAGALGQALGGGEESAATRARAARALGGLPDADPAALAAALSDPEAGVRLEAAWALGRLRARAQAGSLVIALQSDADCRVRAAAAWALSRAGDCSLAAALRQVRDESACRRSAQAAAFTLGELRCD